MGSPFKMHVQCSQRERPTSGTTLLNVLLDNGTQARLHTYPLYLYVNQLNDPSLLISGGFIDNEFIPAKSGKEFPVYGIVSLPMYHTLYSHAWKENSEVERKFPILMNRPGQWIPDFIFPRHGCRRGRTRHPGGQKSPSRVEPDDSQGESQRAASLMVFMAERTEETLTSNNLHIGLIIGKKRHLAELVQPNPGERAGPGQDPHLGKREAVGRSSRRSPIWVGKLN